MPGCGNEKLYGCNRTQFTISRGVLKDISRHVSQRITVQPVCEGAWEAMPNIGISGTENFMDGLEDNSTF
jgi:hypothetical protein